MPADFYAPWEDHEDLVAAAPKAHARNVRAVTQALADYHAKDRPLRVLAVDGGRKGGNSAALLKAGLEGVPEDVEVERIELAGSRIEACRQCASYASAWCGFPCDCHPLDPMQFFYPKVLRSDVLLVATGVNMAGPSSATKLFLDRLISLDGGFYRASWHPKMDFLEAAITLSLSTAFEYTQRMFGRVAAYFITSKDQENPFDADYGYVDQVAGGLRKAFDDFGLFHAAAWYAGWAAKPFEDYSLDGLRLADDNVAHKRAQDVVSQALALGAELRANPPTPAPGRINRT